MPTTCEAKAAKAMPGAKKSKDDEPSTLTLMATETMHAPAEVRATKAMPRADDSKDDEPSTLAPTVIRTMRAKGEVRDRHQGDAEGGAVHRRWAGHFHAGSDQDDARNWRGKRHQGNAQGEEVQR